MPEQREVDALVHVGADAPPGSKDDMTTVRRTQPQATPAAKPTTTKRGVTRVAKAPPKGAPVGPAKTPDMAALQEAFARPHRTVLTRDVFLKSQGPKVVEIDLPNMGTTALMRRVDLLELARRGGEHWPLRSAVLKMIQRGGVDGDMTEGEALAETLDIAAAVALATIVVPPAEYLAACSGENGSEADARAAREAALLAIRPSSLKPFFVAVGEEPDDDQVVLRWFVPDESGEPADSDTQALMEGQDDSDAGWVHWADLIVILRMAHQFGPGALGRRFRGEQPEADAMAALLALAGVGGAEA